VLLIKLLVLPLSLVYAFVVMLRNWLYDVGLFRCYAVDVPVISVGNLTAGGTGKTPILEYIVTQLLDQHYKVAIVSRGYRRASRGTVVVSDGQTILANSLEGGDEPLQLARKFPSVVVIVDEDRVRGARVAIERYGAQVVTLDDGFQHRRLARDLDIVVVDVERPPQKEWLLPAGMRREPMYGLRRAQAIIFSRSVSDGNGVKQYYRNRSSVPTFDAQFVPGSLVRFSDRSRMQPDSMRGKSCLAFCGIARPEVFERTVKEAGLEIKALRAFSDHHRYTPADLRNLAKEARRLHCDFFLTTEKDAVRLDADSVEQIFATAPLYYLELRTLISDGPAFLLLLQRTLAKYTDAHSHHR
jgi:tetraacyldisaccharide 4'-kinase